MKCSFKYEKCVDGRVFYVCKVTNQKIPNTLLTFVGKHFLGLSNNNVQEIRFDRCVINRIPKGLMENFPFLEDISIWKSDIASIKKEDLAEYKTLKRVYIMNSQIEFLPGNLFDGFNNLEEISFEGCKLKIIEPTLLDGLRELKHVNFSQNPNYNEIFSIYPKNNPNATLEEVKDKLHAVFKTYKEIMSLIDKSNQGNSVETQTDTVKRARIVPYTPTEPESQKSISSCVKNYIQDDRFKDFIVHIGDREFPVHKFLLAARSPTLADILLNNPNHEKLNLVGIPADIFETILQYIYTDELPCEEVDFAELFAAAGYLKMEVLKDYAAVNSYIQINRANAIDVLKLSIKYEHSDLKEKSFDRIKREYPKINFKDSWANKPEYIVKVIEKFEQKEIEIKKLEEKFQNEVLDSD
jgi:hypothetical protein